MLRHADRVAVGDLGDGDAFVHRGLKIGMVRADAGGDDELQILRLVEALFGHIGRPEGLRDHDFGVGQLFLEGGIWTVLVGGDDKSVTGLLQKFAKPEFAGDAAEQLPWLEVDGGRGGRGLAVGVMINLGNIVAGVILGIAVDWIVVENAKNFGHGQLLLV